METKDIIITVPKTTRWDDYEKELRVVEPSEFVMWFRVPTLPKNTAVGNRCYVCHDGYIVGYMNIVDMKKLEGFECTTLHRGWEPGFYIGRQGVFHYLSNPVPYKGFQGYRYVNEGMRSILEKSI